MKNIARLFAFVLALAGAPAYAGTFGAEKQLSDPVTGSQFPEVAYFNNIIHVVWVGYAAGVQGDIFYSRSTDAGANFSVPVNLSNSATATNGNDQPQVTAGANGVFVVWNTITTLNNGATVFSRRSIDGGVSFAAATTVASVAGAGYYARVSDAFSDSGGNIHIAYFTNADTLGASGMIHHRMICSGTTLGTDTAVTQKLLDGDVDNEEPRLSEGGGRIWLVFKSSRNGDPQGGWAPYSVQMQSGPVAGCAVTWSYPARKMGGGIPNGYASLYRPEIFGDAGGTVHLAWWDQSKGANVAYRKGTLTTGSGTLGATALVSNFGVDHLQPGGISSSAGVTYGGFQVPPAFASNGTSAFLGYQKHQFVTASTFENGPIYLRESGDNGTTWGAEQPIATTNQATTPRFAIGGAGNTNVAIAWSDIRSGGARVYFRLYTAGAVSGSSFSIGPSPATYANQVVNTTSGAQTFTLLNSGTAGNITAIATSGDFTRSGGTCAVGALGAGASCTITVTFRPTALGTRNGTITVSTDAVTSPSVATLSGTGTVSTVFADNVNAVITGYYETILGRSPDGPGLAFWASEANRVTALGLDVREVFFTMAIQFFASAEYQAKGTSDTQFLTDMYNTFFIRPPDAPGLAFWQSYLDGGVSRGALLNSFLFSTEFSNQMTSIFGTVTVRPEVTLTLDMYRGILGHLPDNGGYTFWLGQLRTAQCAGAAAISTAVNNLSASFFASAEYVARDAARAAPIRNAEYMGDIYNAIMRRGPDLSGYQFWLGQINTAAQTRDQVRQAFLPSAEFQNRANAVIAAGCLP